MLHTPGHTLESSSYLLDDALLFTGDTLFLAAVGRPDLEATPDAARERARDLCEKLLSYASPLGGLAASSATFIFSAA